MSEDNLDQVQENTAIQEETVPAAKDKALKQGWRPQEEWDGDPDEWIDYREFNFRGELYDAIKTKSKQIASMEKSFKEFAEHAQKVKEIEIQKAIDSLKAEKKQALEEQDYDRVVEIDDEIDEVRESVKQKAVTNAQPEIPPFVAYWKEQNTWYDTDPVMRAASEVIANSLVKQDPSLEYDQATLLDEVAKSIRKEFPHKFSRQTPTSKTVSSTGEGTTKPVSTSKTYQLSRQEQETAERFVKLGMVKSVEDYAKELQAINGN